MEALTSTVLGREPEVASPAMSCLERVSTLADDIANVDDDTKKVVLIACRC